MGAGIWVPVSDGEVSSPTHEASLQCMWENCETTELDYSLERKKGLLENQMAREGAIKS